MAVPSDEFPTIKAERHPLLLEAVIKYQLTKRAELIPAEPIKSDLEEFIWLLPPD